MSFRMNKKRKSKNTKTKKTFKLQPAKVPNKNLEEFPPLPINKNKQNTNLVWGKNNVKPIPLNTIYEKAESGKNMFFNF